MEYIQYSLYLAEDADINIVSAYVQFFELDSMWEEEDVLHVFFDRRYVDGFSGNLSEEIREKCRDSVKRITTSVPENINWNAEWEKNFDPVEVEGFCYIYADFHEKKEGFDQYIKIAPKMAFGTGHHETTYMMMKAMQNLDFQGKKVLDLGCGTGILAILAAQLGAESIDAIDIEFPAYENTVEHAEMNKVTFNIQHGGVEDVMNKPYDIVLANINRNVLLQYDSEIISFVKEGGVLLLSGVLKQDEKIVDKAYEKLKFSTIQERGKWLCIQYSKSTRLKK